MVVSPPVASPVGSPVAAPAPGTVEVKEEAKPEEGKCPKSHHFLGKGWEELGGTTELLVFFGEIIVNTGDWVLVCKFSFTFLRIPASSFEDVSNRTPLFCALADASTKKPRGSPHAEVVAGSWRRCA